MTESRGTAETAGKAEPLSEKELSRLLDRTQLYETDEAFCVNELLGEVRAGIAAETAAEAHPEEQAEEQYGPCLFHPAEYFLYLLNVPRVNHPSPESGARLLVRARLSVKEECEHSTINEVMASRWLEYKLVQTTKILQCPPIRHVQN